LISLGVVLLLNLIFLTGRQTTIRVMGMLVFPLIAYFLFLSIYLTGSWQPSLLTTRWRSTRKPCIRCGYPFP
jgi:amino acid permease